MLGRLAMPNGALTAFAFVGIGAGVYLFCRGFRMLKRKRLILNTPTSKIRSASLGLVEVSGLAVGPHTIVSPIAKKPCYYYRTTAWKLEQSGKNKQWKKVADEHLHVPFYLDDNTGRVLVDPRNAEMELHLDFFEQYWNLLLSTTEIPESVRNFLAMKGVSLDASIKIEERCIKPKNAFFVLGTLAENPALEVTEQPMPQSVSALAARSAETLGRVEHNKSPDATELRNRASFAAAMGAHSVGVHAPAHTVVASKPPAAVDDGEQRRRDLFATSFFGSSTRHADHVNARSTMPAINANHNSKLSIDGAEQHRRELFASSVFGLPLAKQAPAEEATIATSADAAAPSSEENGAANGDPATQARDAAENETFDLRPPVVLMKGTHNPEYFISWRSQREVIQELGWKSAAYIWGGPLLTLCSLWILLSGFAVR